MMRAKILSDEVQEAFQKAVDAIHALMARMECRTCMRILRRGL